MRCWKETAEEGEEEEEMKWWENKTETF